MEKETYSFEDIESLRKGLGVDVNAKHAISVVGRKAAAFSSRIKTAISNKYHAFTAAIKNKTVSIANSIDAKAYNFVKEDYQQSMNEKTAKLDEKIQNIQSRMTAIENAEVGLKSNQVKDEKDRAYLLHKASDLLQKYKKEKNAIEQEQEALENYKQQEHKIKIAGKRRIKIAKDAVKKMAVNAVKATGRAAKAVGLGIASIPGRIKNANTEFQAKWGQKKEEKDILKQIENLSDEEFEQLTQMHEYYQATYENPELTQAEEYTAIQKLIVANPNMAGLAKKLFDNSLATKEVEQEKVEEPVAENFESEEKEAVVEQAPVVEPEQPVIAVEKTVEERIQESYEKGYADGYQKAMQELKMQMDAMQKQIDSLTKGQTKEKEATSKSKDINAMSLKELKELAKELNIKSSKMNKAELVQTLQETNTAKKK